MFLSPLCTPQVVATPLEWHLFLVLESTSCQVLCRLPLPTTDSQRQPATASPSLPFPVFLLCI
eukprot:m.351431 g.351431  ORF g.351431 m.351431 type:complete len:63 (+) comp16241_c0_seq1:4175-4363(+)